MQVAVSQFTTPLNSQQMPSDKVPLTANVAIFATYKSDETAIEDVCFYIENNLSDITQLPELFFIDDKSTLNDEALRERIADLSELFIRQISAVLRPYQYVCTSLVIEGQHQAVIISEQGIFAKQQQLHYCQRYQWTALSDVVNIIELPLEQGNITVAMLTADDAKVPEIVSAAALHGVHTLLVPFDIQEAHEVESSLIDSAVENRICIVAATREKSFVIDEPIKNKQRGNKKKVKSQKSTGLIINLTSSNPLLAQWQSKKQPGILNSALIKHQQGKITKAVIHPIAACEKLIVN